MTSKLTFIRHAHTVWNGPPKRFQGRADVSLSETGIAQCRARQGEFDWVKRIVASPAKRVQQTVDLLFENAAYMPPISHDPNLWEIDNRDYSGKYIDQVREQYPENFHLWMTEPGHVRPGGGESLLDMLTRAILSIRKIREGGIDGTLVATHGGIIRVLTLASRNMSLNQFHELNVGNLDRFSLNEAELDALEFRI